MLADNKLALNAEWNHKLLAEELNGLIDIFTTAVHHGVNVEQLNDPDLSYTPPLSSP